MDRTITLTTKELTLVANILRGLEPIRRGLPPERVEMYPATQPKEFVSALGKIEAAKWKSSSHDQELLR